MSRRRGALPTDGPAAIVLGLDEGTVGIQTARILARRDVPVVALAGNPRHPSCRTRVCPVIAAGNTHGDAIVDVLEEVGAHLGQRAVIFPCSDANVAVVSRHRERLAAWYEIVLPPHDVVAMMMDKAAFARFAERHGLPVPPTFALEETRDVDAAADALRFPCILKPVLRDTDWNRHTAAKAFRVNDASELRRLYEAHRHVAPTMIAQAWVRGDDTEHYTTNVYVDGSGEVAVSFTSRKLRQWPRGTGQGCLSVEARNDEVAAQAERLFGLVPFRGLGYLEMKRDADTGACVIIEPNVGRPTGRSANAERAGVELLHTMFRDALGLPLPAARTQPFASAKWIHLRRDAQAAFTLWRSGDLSLREWAQSWRGLSGDAIFDWRDPLPFLADAARVVAEAGSISVRRRPTPAVPHPR